MTGPVRRVLLAIVAFDLVFLSLPTLVILVASFTPGSIIAFPPQGFSLRWYASLLERQAFTDALLRSLWVATVCTLASLPAGTFAALALAGWRRRGRTALQLYLLLPFTIPLVVSGLGLMLVFGRLGHPPVLLWAVAASANRLDPDLENAAMNCGAPPTHAFFTVTLPAVMPGVITGGLIMFVLAVNEFLVSLMLVDARTVTLPVLVYNAIRSVITPDLAAVSVVYIALGAAAIWLLDRLVGLEIFLRSR
jgi:putative spermidine/putrescine transport system permease protein